MYGLRRVALRALSFSAKAPTAPRRFSQLIDRAPAFTQCKTPNAQQQRRWLADEAATTQSEPVAEGSDAAQNVNADNSIASSSGPTDDLEPPTTEEQAAEMAAEAPTTTQSKPDLADAEGQSALDSAAETAKIAASTAASQVSQAVQDPIGTFSSEEPQQIKKNLYIGNLFFDVREEDLKREFERAGTVISARIITDARGLSKGFGYIDFATEEEAARAIQLYHMQNFEGRRLTVQYAIGRSRARNPHADPSRENRAPSAPTKTLFIGNMSFDMSDRDLNALFREVKNVIDVRVAIDRRTGQPRGFAHADFTDVESAMKAAEELRGKLISGRMLRVDFSHSTGRAAL